MCYFGTKEIRLARKEHLGGKWEVGVDAILAPRKDMFDEHGTKVFGGWAADGTFLVFYDSSYASGNRTHVQIGAALFSYEDPTRMIWRSEEPVFEEVIDGTHKIEPLTLSAFKEGVVAYWRMDGKTILSLSAPRLLKAVTEIQAPRITKHEGNPILSPIHEHDWENDGTFNATAVNINGVVHMLYRGIGRNGVGTFGYARSEDGVNITERSHKPVYFPRQHFEGSMGPVKAEKKRGKRFNESGGRGWGGVEDPKLSRVGDRVYLTYVAFNGTWPTRAAMSSISVNDFVNQRWRWTEPVLMSTEHADCKSPVILPEKVNGKYVVFHRVWPDIVVDYVDDLDFEPEHTWLDGFPSIFPWKQDGRVLIKHGSWDNVVEELTEHDDDYKVLASDRWHELTKDTRRIKARSNHWDSHKISMGAAPIKTKYGWLAMYSAVDRKDFSRYKIGAMLLDLEDPQKVLYRTNRAVIGPYEWYENEGKFGVVYPGGAVVKDDTLFVYYGGADRVTAVAHAPLDEFLRDLMQDHHTDLKLNFKQV